MGIYCYNCMNEIKEGTFCTACMAENAQTNLSHHLKPGTVLNNKYLVGNVLGEGGFGVTYIGRDTTLDIKVAIKEYFPNGYVNRNNEFTSEITTTTDKQKDFFEKGKRRFLLEARSIAKFNAQKGVVDVRDYFEENGTAYIIMEYLEGITLADYIKQNGTMDATELFTLMIPVMRSLEKMHEQGVVHRDISPDNIMYQSNGTFKLMDFGSARYFNNQENVMSIVLKMGYAPEEQYRKNGHQGPWTDVYAMCATMYRCITGKVPEEALDRLHVDNLQPPSSLGVSISKPLQATLMYGLAVRRENRCQSMTELLDITQRALSGAFVQTNHQNIQSPEYKTVAVDDMLKTQAADDDFDGNGYSYHDNFTKQPHTVNQEGANKNNNFTTGLIAGAAILFIVAIAILIGVVLFSAMNDDDTDNGKNNDTSETVEQEQTEEATEEETEEPTEPPTEEPTVNKKDVSLYTDVIEEALGSSTANSQYARGYLYDLNSDGSKELIMLYDSGASAVTSVYSIGDYGVEPLLYEKELYEYVGGPFGCVSVVKEDGKILFCTNGETGETSGYNMYRYGFWDLYHFDGDELRLEYDSDYEYYSDGSNINYGSSSARVNGSYMSYSAYKDWLNNDLELVAYLSYDMAGVSDSSGYEPTSGKLKLNDLLKEVNK